VRSYKYDSLWIIITQVRAEMRKLSLIICSVCCVCARATHSRYARIIGEESLLALCCRSQVDAQCRSADEMPHRRGVHSPRMSTHHSTLRACRQFNGKQLFSSSNSSTLSCIFARIEQSQLFLFAFAIQSALIWMRALTQIKCSEWERKKAAICRLAFVKACVFLKKALYKR